jgi:hypothetical protein
VRMAEWPPGEVTSIRLGRGLHIQAVDHARHTIGGRGEASPRPPMD